MTTHEFQMQGAEGRPITVLVESSVPKKVVRASVAGEVADSASEDGGDDARGLLPDFSGTLSGVEALLQNIYAALNTLDPDEISVTVGVEIASGSVIKLLTDSKGNMNVTMKWSGKKG